MANSFYPDLQNSTFPGEIDVFTNFLNILATDGTLVNQYQTAMKAGDLATAQAILAQIPNASQKVLTADKLNKYKDAIIALERFWTTDIEPYIDTKQTEWENTIDLFSYIGEYNPSVQYQKNNLVDYTSLGIKMIYICTATPPIGTAPTNTSYWRVLTIQGVKGDSGVGLSFVFAWSAAQAYALQNVVSYENALWGCIQANTNQPPFDGSTYWQYVASLTGEKYPVQSTAPPGLSTGALWFQTL